MMRAATVAAGLLLLVLLTSACAQTHEVTSLPGWDRPLPTRQFAGYIDVGNQKSLYYYFVHSERDITKAPLVLWLNGGPGCSSFCAFVYEHGPFEYKLHESGEVTLTANPNSWHKAANIIYLDSPAGVGMSYSPDKQQYITNDTQTAIDANTFIRNFLQLYPEFQANDFYIAGESYAGVYVPNLALHVADGNRQGQTPAVNLKGYLVGNGCTDPKFDANAFPLFALGKSLISVEQYSALVDACNGNFYTMATGSKCERLLLQMQDELADLNLYDILETCYYPPDKAPAAGRAASQSYTPLTAWKQVRQLRERHRGWPVQAIMQPGQQIFNWQHLLKLDPPCIDSTAATAWLNKQEVREAIHAAPVAMTGGWTICTDKIAYTNDVPTMLPIHNTLIQSYGLRALIYSGDHDLCVPHTGSEAWTRSMNYPLVSAWQPWYYREAWTRQVAGYYVEYQGLTYATVKGAGHMAPQTNPKESYTMFHAFLHGRPLSEAHLTAATDALINTA